MLTYEDLCFLELIFSAVLKRTGYIYFVFLIQNCATILAFVVICLIIIDKWYPLCFNKYSASDRVSLLS